MIFSNVKQKCGPLSPRSAVNLNKLNFNNWNRIVHQNALWSLVFSTTRPWNKQISAPDASQPSSQERWQVADLKHLKTSYIFSLPRISTKDFPYIKEKIDWSIGINYSSVDFKWTQVFLCCQAFDRGQWILLKIQVIQDKSKPKCVAIIWLRVKVNRTRPCTAAHFARNEIKYQKSREKGLFQYNLYTRTIACLSFIPLYRQKFYKCYSLSPSQKSEESKKLP